MYSRFTALENYNENDLNNLKNSKVAVVGLGATGSVIAENLARHGVNLKLIDRDYLEENDTYSSSIYTPEECQKSIPKAEAASEKLSKFTEVKSYVEHLDGQNIEILDDIDIVVDGTDNMDTRFLINEYCKKENIPWIYTAAISERGYSMLIDDSCFNCIFDNIKPGSLGTCESEGIMREISGIAALKTSLKTVKYLTGKTVNENLDIIPSGRSLETDSEGCTVCRDNKFNYLESTRKISSVCGESKYQIHREISGKAFDRLKDQEEVIADNKYLTRVNINGKSFALFKSGRAIIEARNEEHAQAIFSEVLG